MPELDDVLDPLLAELDELEALEVLEALELVDVLELVEVLVELVDVLELVEVLVELVDAPPTLDEELAVAPPAPWPPAPPPLVVVPPSLLETPWQAGLVLPDGGQQAMYPWPGIDWQVRPSAQSSFVLLSVLQSSPSPWAAQPAAILTAANGMKARKRRTLRCFTRRDVAESASRAYAARRAHDPRTTASSG
jgi:hypothetical protein